MKARFVTVVWGEAYTEAFLRAALPSHLAPGNLPALAGGGRPRYTIYTRTVDRERIARSAAFARLAFAAEARIEARDEVPLDDRYRAMSRFHSLAIEAARAAGEALVFLPPDAVFSDGSFRALAEMADRGRAAVLIAGLRAVKETFLPELATRFARDDGTVTVPPRELAGLALRHLHPFCRSLFWDSPAFSGYPSNVCWRAGEGGALIRAFHLHPVYLRAPGPGAALESTIDDHFLAAAGLRPEDLEVVTDSDRILAVEFSESARWEPWPPNRAGALAVAVWAKHEAGPLHRAFFRQPIRMHADGGTGPAWDEAGRASARVARRVFRFLAFEPLLFRWRPLAVRLGTRLLGEARYRKARESLRRRAGRG